MNTATYSTWGPILNIVDIRAELPYEIAREFTINKATDEQINEIKFLLNRVSALYPHTLNPFETDNASASVPSHAPQYLILPRTLWRYYVVSTEGGQEAYHDIDMVSSITDIPFELSPFYFPSTGTGSARMSGRIINPTLFGNLPMAFMKKNLVQMSTSHLDELSRLYAEFIRLAGSEINPGPFPEIRRAFTLFYSLRHLPTQSINFYVLGLFSVIEMLITHNPNSIDIGDSISHQIRSKIPLLSNRFDTPLSMEKYFSSTDNKKIWSALYSYRSAIAHGGEINFSSGKLQILKSVTEANNFLKEAVMTLLRHSVKEPQLMADLKNC